MSTIERLNSLWFHYFGTTLPEDYLSKRGTLGANYFNPRPGHLALDCLDGAAGITTDGAYLGARLALHEEFLAASAPLHENRDRCAGGCGGSPGCCLGHRDDCPCD